MGARLALVFSFLLFTFGIASMLGPAFNADQLMQKRQTAPQLMSSASFPNNLPSVIPTVPGSASSTPVPSSTPEFLSTSSSISTTSPTTSTISSATPSPTTDSASQISSSSAASSSTQSSIRTYTTPLVVTSQELVVTLTTRVFGGSTSIGEYTTSTPVVLTTGFATATNPAQLLADGNSGQGSGIPPTTQKIVGAVVGGVGGAILVGCLALLLWRRLRKRPQEDDNDVDDKGFAHRKQISQGSDQTNTDGSERYHKTPTISVNAASNF